MEKDQIMQELDKASKELEQRLECFTKEEFNQKPEGESWSAGDVAEHLLLLETRVNRALEKGNPIQRAADMKILPIKNGLENLERRFTAPEFILPTAKEKDRDASTAA